MRSALSLTILPAARDIYVASWARECAVLGADRPLGGVEKVAIVRSRDRCLLLRFTILERAVLGSNCEQGGCARRFGTLIECTLSLAKKVGSVRAAKTYHIPLYRGRPGSSDRRCSRTRKSARDIPKCRDAKRPQNQWRAQRVRERWEGPFRLRRGCVFFPTGLVY